MSGRLVSSGIALAVLAAAFAIEATIAGCYDVPRPICGFACGPDGACPDGYACAADRYCHRIGAPADLICMPPDARLPIDASFDGRTDAKPDAGIGAARDAIDVAMDAAIGAAIGAAIDAVNDAVIDAPMGAPPDAAGDAAAAASAPH